MVVVEQYANFLPLWANTSLCQKEQPAGVNAFIKPIFSKKIRKKLRFVSSKKFDFLDLI